MSNNHHPKLPTQAQQVRKNSVGWLLNVSASIAKNHLKDTLKPLAVTPEQFRLLMSLLEKDGISQSALAKKANLPQYSVTRHLDNLAEKQLVRREADPNSRRNLCVFVTDKGKQFAPQLYQAVDVVNQQLLANLSADEIKQLQHLLSKIIQ